VETICDVLPRDRIEGRDDRNDVVSGRSWVVRGSVIARRVGVNICARGVVVVGRSKRDKGGIRGILSVSLRYYAYLCLLT
jgi:hypothetical protein